MSTSMWLRQLRKRLFASQLKNRGRKPRPSTAQRRFRPCLEALEDRLVLDAVQTVAVSTSAPFSESSQNVTLKANVTDLTSSGTAVTEGKVTFTVIDASNSKTIGTAAGNVTSKSNGQASATFGLPALTNVGSYTIKVAYSDAGGPNTDGGDTPGTLAVTAASTTTTAQNATATFNTKAEDVKLTASVSSDAGTVDEGKVKFTVVNSTGKAIGTAASGTVTSSGSASVNYGLPAFTNVGSYTIEASYSDSTGNFGESDNSTQSPKPAVSVTAASTTTTASGATTPFSTKAEDVKLTASVTSSAGTVDEGKVKFTVVNSTGKAIGTAASGTVTKSGSASVSYGLPAFTNVGSYTIEASYSDSTGNFGASDNSTQSPKPALSVTAASSATTAQSATATFSTKAEDVKLTASVTSSAGTVDEGKVKFTVVNSTGKAIGTAASGTVTKSGSASVSYGLPAFTNVGSYTIEASYSDSTGNFGASDNSTQSPKPAVSVSAAHTTTTAQNATATFSSSSQDVTLTANVTSSAGAVDEGKVKFTVVSGTGKTIGTASGTVTKGSASGTMGLPAFTNVGSYTIKDSYSDSTGNFADSDNSSQSPKPALTVSAATSTTLSLTSASIVPNASGSNAQVTLTAQVSNPNGAVNEGVVSFTLDGVTEQGNVSNGVATAQLSVPTSSLNIVSNVTLAYSDTGGPGNFSDGNGSATLATNFFNTTFSATLTYNSDGTVNNDLQLGGQTVIGFVYTAWGAPTEIDVASLTLPVTYTTLPGGDVLVSIDGKPWQLNQYDSSGQFLGLATLNLNADGSTNWILLNSSYQPIGELPAS